VLRAVPTLTGAILLVAEQVVWLLASTVANLGNVLDLLRCHLGKNHSTVLWYAHLNVLVDPQYRLFCKAFLEQRVDLSHKLSSLTADKHFLNILAPGGTLYRLPTLYRDRFSISTEL
jgi:hypothetical protein